MKSLVLNTWVAKLSQDSFLKFKMDIILYFVTSNTTEEKKKKKKKKLLAFSLINNQTKDVFRLQENSLNCKDGGFIRCNKKHLVIYKTKMIENHLFGCYLKLSFIPASQLMNLEITSIAMTNK